VYKNIAFAYAYLMIRGVCHQNTVTRHLRWCGLNQGPNVVYYTRVTSAVNILVDPWNAKPAGCGVIRYQPIAFDIVSCWSRAVGGGCADIDACGYMSVISGVSGLFEIGSVWAWMVIGVSWILKILKFCH
jgi:hypothetical protein